MQQQKFCNVAEKNKATVEGLVEKNFPQGKIAKPPIYQERTKRKIPLK